MAIKNWLEKNFQVDPKYRAKNDRVLGKLKPHQIASFEPKKLDDVVKVANHLKTSIGRKNSKSAVLNLNYIEEQQEFYRIMDFLNGVLFAIDGSMQKIAPKMYILTPKTASVSHN